jgi:hypothetical protein
MARSYPLSAAGFFGGLRIAEMALDLGAAVQSSRTRGGEVIQAALGNRLWSGSAMIWRDDNAPMDSVRADLFALSQTGASFMVTPVHRVGPQADPDGAILGASAPVLHTIAANRREMRISGLPAAYQIRKGDYLSIAYGSSPVRYWFGQVVVGATADGAGLTPLLEFVPPLPAGVTTSLGVTLLQPAFKAVMAPGGLSYGTIRRVKTDGLSFNFIQTFGQ